MDGNFIKEKLQLIDIQFVELSKKLGITPQSLNSRLKTKDITISFLIELCEAINKSPYYFIKGSEYEKYFTLDESVLKNDIPTENSNAISDKIKILEEQNNLLRENKEQSHEIINLYKEKIKTYEQMEAIETRLGDLEQFNELIKLKYAVDLEIENTKKVIKKNQSQLTENTKD
jgi:transcriptional regulator with XRE-family HTH domain